MKKQTFYIVVRQWFYVFDGVPYQLTDNCPAIKIYLDKDDACSMADNLAISGAASSCDTYGDSRISIDNCINPCDGIVYSAIILLDGKPESAYSVQVIEEDL